MYATEGELIVAFGAVEVDRLADRDGDGTPDAGVLARALADASAEIDAALAVRYQVPVAPIPGVLRRIACDIARYRLYDKQPHLDGHKPEWRVRYEDAVRQLEGYAKGTLALVDDDGHPLPLAAVGAVAALARRMSFDARQQARYDRVLRETGA